MTDDGRTRRLSRPRCDQSGFVGQDDGLDSVTESELRENVRHMCLDGRLAEEQLGADLAVRPSMGDSANEVVTHRRHLFPPEDPSDPTADVAYQVMSAVPENWIPFPPVHVPGGTRRIQLQRAKRSPKPAPRSASPTTEPAGTTVE